MTETTDGTQTETTTTGADKTGAGEGEKATFTQTELNRIVGERAARAGSAAVNALLEKLGVKTPEELATTFAEFRKKQESELSEVEKQKAALEKSESEKKALQEALESEKQARITEKVNNSLRGAAKLAHDANDVVLLIRSNYAEELAKLVTEAGDVDEKGLTDLMAKVRKAKPHLFQTGTPGSPSNAGGRPPDLDTETKKVGLEMLRAQRKSIF